MNFKLSIVEFKKDISSKLKIKRHLFLSFRHGNFPTYATGFFSYRNQHAACELNVAPSVFSTEEDWKKRLC